MTGIARSGPGHVSKGALASGGHCGVFGADSSRSSSWLVEEAPGPAIRIGFFPALSGLRGHHPTSRASAAERVPPTSCVDLVRANFGRGHHIATRTFGPCGRGAGRAVLKRVEGARHRRNRRFGSGHYSRLRGCWFNPSIRSGG